VTASSNDAVIEPCLDEVGHSSQPPSQNQNLRIMPDLSAFPITQRWPGSHSDRLQLYAEPTPKGVKVSIMLEETGLTYEPHLIDISNNESNDPAFVSLNPNGRIPAIIDPGGPDGRPIARRASSSPLRQPNATKP
jgi:GST-like protein